MSEKIQLRVSEASLTDVSLGRARIDTESRKLLEVESGEFVVIEGRRKTIAKVFRCRPEDEGKKIIRIDQYTRKNARVSIGERVTVYKAEVENAVRITLAPVIEKGQKIKISGNFENYIKNFLLRRGVVEGDHIPIPAVYGRYMIYFEVVKTFPKDMVVVTPDTVIEIVEESSSEMYDELRKVAYEDIGGLKDKLKKIREMIELPIKHPEVFEKLGIEPPKGVLLYGPPGTGKTLIARAVANESGAYFVSINGPEIMNKFYGESERKLREIFEEAERKAPSIIFIDEIDAIAPKRDEVTGEVEKRVVAQLLTLMDGLKRRGKVIVIGATNRIDAVDPALRRPGRFDREIEIGIPDKEGRKEILQIHMRGMPIEGGDEEKEKIIEELASVTHGFVGADLAALVREAAMRALRRYIEDLDLDKPIPPEVIAKMVVTREDFKEALKEIEPSALREIMVEIPTVRWEDIGGLEDVKRQLVETVELPIKDPMKFKRMGIRPPRGILLYGPPGCGKTLIAKAVATESSANFISIKGPEILSKWVGESEKAIRMIFKRARQVAPCIVFLDEIDAIAPRRGYYSDSGVTERIVNQLLTSIDGLESIDGVVVIAATNRPDILDPALIRAGRFDYLIYIPPPDKESRKKILEVHTRNMPLAPDVSLEKIAEMTERYVGADLENLCREAGMVAIRENANVVEMRHFLEALKKIPPSLDEESIKYYENIGKELMKTFRHKKERTIYHV